MYGNHIKKRRPHEKEKVMVLMFTKLTVTQDSLSRSADFTHLAIINLGKLVNFVNKNYLAVEKFLLYIYFFSLIMQNTYYQMDQ